MTGNLADLRRNRALACATLVALLSGLLPAAAWAQDDPAALVAAAGEQYDWGDYQQALDLLDRITLEEDTPAKTAFDVHVLRGRCLVGLGNNDLARDSFCAAHLLDREWTPDPVVFLPAEIEVFASSLEGCRTGGGTPWGWIAAGGALVVGAVAFLVVGGDDGGDTTGSTALPGFPDMPANKDGTAGKP